MFAVIRKKAYSCLSPDYSVVLVTDNYNAAKLRLMSETEMNYDARVTFHLLSDLPTNL